MKTEINVSTGKIQAYEDSHEVGNLEFELQNAVMTITHTHAYQKGMGIGNVLMVAAIEYATENHLKIRPVCSYAYAMMVKNPDYSKLLTDDAGEGISCRL